MITELSKLQLEQLTDIIKTHLNSFYIKNIMFANRCGCYSEYTRESCCFGLEVEAKLTGTKEEQWKKQQEIETDIQYWVEKNLEYYGCECCDHLIWVDLRLIPKTK